jgi:hypothetical protein
VPVRHLRFVQQQTQNAQARCARSQPKTFYGEDAKELRFANNSFRRRVRSSAQARAISVTSVSSVVKNDLLDPWRISGWAGRCWFTTEDTEVTEALGSLVC